MTDHAWLGPALERVGALVSMPAIHNSYGCLKIDPGAAKSAVLWLFAKMLPETPMPRITPEGRAGLRFEWMDKGSVNFGAFFHPGADPEYSFWGASGPSGKEDLDRAVEEAISALTAGAGAK
jgi:hypothetical protein